VGEPAPYAAVLSSTYGFERGTPIDRTTCTAFSRRHRGDIRGAVLEVQTRSYTERFGAGVTRSDTFDSVPNLHDLSRGFHDRGQPRPDGTYDCVLLPNTLPHFRDLDAGLARARARCVRRRRSGVRGCLLPLTGDVPEFLALLSDGWRERLRRAWPDAAIEVPGHGNCLSSIAAQLGLAVEELAAARNSMSTTRVSRC